MKRLKVKIDINLSRLKISDDDLKDFAREVADKITDQVKDLGPGRIDYEVVEEE